jgi:glycerate dehydrogenase
MQAVFLDYATVSYADLDASALTKAAHDLRFYDLTADSQIAERIRDARIVLLNKLKLSRDLLHDARGLRLIAVAGTGTDNVDLATAKERGIAVCNVRGYCTPSVVQHTWAMILSLTQRLSENMRIAAGGSWAGNEQFAAVTHNPAQSAPLSSPCIRELAGRTLGVVGWGELGRAVARVGETFGMRIAIANRPGESPAPGRLDLAQLLATADIVSLHCPLTRSTQGMIGVRELALMKPQALLINTARGALIDTGALAGALRAGRLGGAGIDVLPQEPPIDGDPLLDPDIPNLILTPHVAWSARESRQRCIDEMAANIQDFLSGGRRGRVV